MSSLRPRIIWDHLGCRKHSSFGNNQWIGLRENLQENIIFDGKIHGFL
jgi:hypothetical protein